MSATRAVLDSFASLDRLVCRSEEIQSIAGAESTVKFVAADNGNCDDVPNTVLYDGDCFGVMNFVF